ncbi:MAG TPA: hypothetical protein VK652_01335, partial [Steroidobacteraceae bacterium]|nr:hypothetical protein [Steroidobacteraceae bacterium]
MEAPLMAGIIRPQNKQIIDPQTNRLTLEWDAYFARLEALATSGGGGGGGGVTTFEGRSGAVVGVVGDYDASEITNVPAGTIAATDVQGALAELDGDIAGKQAADATLTALAAFPRCH